MLTIAAAVLPAPGVTRAAAAAPVPISMTVGVQQFGSNPDHYLVAELGRVQATGTVVFSLDGIEVGRANLTNLYRFVAEARLYIESSDRADQLLTATYLGSDDYLPTTASATVSFPPVSVASLPTSGALTIGQAVFPISDPFIDAQRTYLDPESGRFSVNGFGSALTTTVPTPGGGSAVLTVQPYVKLDGVVLTDGVLRPSAEFSLRVLRVAVDGVTTNPGCLLSFYRQTTTSVTVGPGHFASTTAADLTTWAGALDFGGCPESTALLDSVLSGPVSLDLDIESPIFQPAPPVAPVETTTSLEILNQPLAEANQRGLQLRATVITANGRGLFGDVRFDVGGVSTTVAAQPPPGEIGSAVATFESLDDLPAGPLEITATYLGSQTREFDYLPSSAAETVSVQAAPTGRPAQGSLAFGTRAADPLPTGTRLIGAAFDPATGVIEPGFLLTPTIESTATYAQVNIDLKSRLRQVGQVGGQVSADGQVTFDPMTFELETYSAIGDFPPVTLTDCTSTFTLTLAGTADDTGLQLEAVAFDVPPLPASACASQGALVNSLLGPGTLLVDVDGDFSRLAGPATLPTDSLFAEVAQYNQSQLLATAPPGAEGTITFRDGADVLATAPANPNGTTTVIAELPSAGTRTITAQYSGDAQHDPTHGATTIVVTPPPGGLALTGTGTVGDVGLSITEGSQIVPQGGTPAAGAPPLSARSLSGAVASSRARLWFAPTNVNLTLPDHGDVSAEVRLVQGGQLSQADVTRDGGIRGLSGAFALHIRSVSTADGTVIPIGCANVVLLSLDGQVRLTDASLTSVAGGSARYPLSGCNGVGRAVVEHLAGTTVSLDLDVAY